MTSMFVVVRLSDGLRGGKSCCNYTLIMFLTMLGLRVGKSPLGGRCPVDIGPALREAGVKINNNKLTKYNK